MKYSADNLPLALASPRSRRITRSLATRSLLPNTAIPPFTPPPWQHVACLSVIPQHGDTPTPAPTAQPTLANFYEPIDDDLLDKTPPGGDLHTSSPNSPSFLTPPSPREEHTTDKTPTPAPPVPTTGFATAPKFLAPANFGAPAALGNPALATTTTRVLEISPPILTNLDRILAAISGINARFDNQNV